MSQPKSQLKNKTSKPKSTRVARKHSTNERQRYFTHIQAMLTACHSFDAMTKVCPLEFPYKIENSISNKKQVEGSKAVDTISPVLLETFDSVADSYITPVTADGNCLPRAASMLVYGTEDNHVEMGVRLVQELILHESKYLDNGFLSLGVSYSKQEDLASCYATYADNYNQNLELDVKAEYRKEVSGVIHSGSYCGIWQIHALASVMSAPVESMYPGLGPPAKHLHRRIMPRALETQEVFRVLWTSTWNSDVHS